MRKIETLEALEALYGEPAAPALRKVATRLTPLYRQWIMASRFCVVSSVGPEGTDGSPRGDDGPVVQELDEHTLLLPDWRGNNRIDSLRNILRDGRISLMFMVPGSDTIVRVNGRAVLSDDADLLARFSDKGRMPRCVIVISIAEVYSQCSRAPMRAGLWTSGDQSTGLPTVGQILAEQSDGEVGGPAYDAEWAGRAKTSMW